MAELAGTAGGVYTSPLLVEDCEAVWTTGGAGRAVSTTTGKVGTYAARVTTTTIGATTLLQYKDFASKNLSTYNGIIAWVRSSLTTVADALQIQLDDTSACASPLENLSLPVITANTWRQVFAKFSAPSALTAIISVGLYQVTDLADGTFDIDDVYAVKLIGGIKSWTLDATVDTLDQTDFADGNATNAARTFRPGLSQWSGSFEGYKDGAPLAISFTTPVHLALQESATSGQGWIGMAYVTGIHPNVAVDGIVTYSYDFTGTGELTEATL